VEVTAPQDSPTTAPAADSELARVELLVQQRRNGEAKSRLVRWFKRNPTSPVRDRGLYLMAQALYQYGDRIRAFYYLDELLDEHPDSPLFSQAMESQFRIADAYLDGSKRRFLRMPMFHAYDEAIDMLYRIQARAPGSQVAERALLRTADFYFADSQYDLAADAYQAYARSYPRSPASPRVKLRQAFANYAQFRGLRFDATPLVDARAQLNEIVAQYPELAQEEGLPAVLERIDRTFAEKLYVTADFYRRTHEPRAAAYTYRYLIDAYPNTPEAQKAQQALARLPATVREAPPPATQPVSALDR
jgi:outer membrane protein assembly factor BamD